MCSGVDCVAVTLNKSLVVEMTLLVVTAGRSCALETLEQKRLSKSC